MKWPSFSRWNIEHAAGPWGDRPSILRFLESARPGDQGEPPELPDNERISARGIRWAAGAMDGVGTHHMGRRTEADPAGPLWTAIADVVADADDARVGRLYELAAKETMVGLADAVVTKAGVDGQLDRERLRRVARWLTREAADREPVKLGIAILGVVGDAEDRASLERLARHDEFTLFAVVALVHLKLLTWIDLWEIGKSVHGWGRVHVVERLGDCKDPRVRRWLVREGFRNSVMEEYLALLCAESGDLAGELEEARVDDELLEGASRILRALTRTTWGGPAAGFESYARGMDAVRAFLRHAAERRGSLGQLLAVNDIANFGEDATSDWSTLVSIGWTPDVRAEVVAEARRIVARPEWRDLVLRDIRSTDVTEFQWACTAADVLGLDCWEENFQRAAKGDGVADMAWHRSAAASSVERMKRFVALAESKLPLDAIAMGPAIELGVGREWMSHIALDVVLRELRRYPGEGWTLIRAGMRSPKTGNRDNALRALAAWDRAAWPPDAEELVRVAARDEPEAKTRENLERLLRGEPMA